MTAAVRVFLELASKLAPDPWREEATRALASLDEVDSKKPDHSNGFVYYIQRGDTGGPIKIGWSSQVEARLAELQCGAAEKLYLLGKHPGSLRDEKVLHIRFHRLRLNGEWFEASPELLSHIQESVR